MGLDITLGVLVLVAAVRGWFRGFLGQAIRLASLVACVYLADPIRDVALPYAHEQLPTIRPELLAKLLWWVAAAGSFVVLAGVATGILKLSRRKPYGEADPHRGDQSAGFLLGATKGLIVAAFLVAGIDRYAAQYLKNLDWVQEQLTASQAMALGRQYRPADRIWDSPPIRQYVAHVRRHGIQGPPQDLKSEGISDQKVADQPRQLEVPAEAEPAERPMTEKDLNSALDTIERELKAQEAAKSR
ncbi:MAG TPA: CvpA family protein [Isosphaeraceae bacterium]|jgi:uncharacterized membrane protein required for colicin V production|nr:CvpA family protein [Isosphaeraceae bacterium]